MKKTLHFFGAIALLFCVVAGPVVYAQLPTVTSVSPSIGYPASTVTITGTNFNTTTTNNIVFFGATQATVSSATTTSLVVTVPTGATYMPVSVDNMASHLTGFSNYPFLPDYNNNQYVPGVVNFDPYLDFTAGSSPEDVAIADIDGDGKPDLVVINVSSNTISVYRNISTVGSITSGSFAAKVDFVTGTSPGYLVIGDIDGDGKPDIIVTNEGANTMSVFRNTSTTGSITTGSLAAKVDFATCGDTAYLAIGDIDGDGKPDIVVSSLLPGTDTFSIYHNTSTSGSITTGSFATRVNFTTGAGPQGVAIGDIDGDGKPDLAVCYGTSTVAVFRNIGTVGSITTGSFASGVSYSTSGSDPIFPLIEDMDGDGKPEMIVNNFSSSSVAVFHNTSTVGSITTGSFASPVNFATGTWPSTLAIGDIDGDGKPDIASNNQGSNSVSILRNISTTGSITTGSFAAHVDFSTATFPNSVAIGDLDGDGKPEIVASITTGFVTVLRNDPLDIIKGNLNICGAGSSTTLSDTTTGGTWSSSNTGVATVGSSTGVVTGVAGGTATITYMLTSGAYTTAVVNIGAIITTIAGNGTFGFNGDGGPATAASLNSPWDVVTDAMGNVYFTDQINYRVRKINSSGIITTIAGNGTLGYSGDGGPATAAELTNPGSITLDGAGNIYVCTFTRLRKIDLSGNITTVAGDGSTGYSGDGVAATATSISNGVNAVLDASGNIYIADQNNNRIRKVNTSGIISTIAGNGTPGHTGDGLPATAAEISSPISIAIDAAGNLYFGEVIGTTLSYVRKINTSGIISTICGGASGFSGDGGLATAAEVNPAQGLCTDASGNLYIADYGNNRIREINTSGIITTVAGGSSIVLGDGGPATAALVRGPTGVFVDAFGSMYIADNNGSRIRKVSTLSPTVAPITGTTNICPGSTSTLSDATTGGTWSSSNTAVATIGSSTGIVSGVSDGSATITYLVSGCGSAPAYASTTVYVGVPIITTIAGNGTAGYSGDGGPATAAELNGPQSVATDALGNTYTADFFNNRVRKVSSFGIITTIAGTGTAGFSGDGTAATNAKLSSPSGVAVDASGNVYIADYGNSCVREVNTSGIISTIAGTGGTTGFHGDGGPATSALFNGVQDITIDATGNLYVIDAGNSRIRKINTLGVISTIAGNGTFTHSGDGLPATSAGLNIPINVGADGAGNVYISENGVFYVRKVNTSGIISTITGTGTGGFGGDGAAATSAQINQPRGLTADAAGNVYFADEYNNRIRQINTSGIISTVVGGGSTLGDGGPATSAELSTPIGITYSASGSLYIGDFSDYRIRKVSGGVTPTPAAITGTFNVCPAATIALSDATPGGVWSSGSPGIATVGSTGIVTGVAAGVATISYTVTGGCGNAYATQVVTVNPAPNAGTITGTLNVCPAATTPLSDVAGGGLWSSVSPGIATVGSTGIVTGVAPGTDTIRYTSTTVCGTTAANQVVTVNPLPNAGSITGTFNVCPAATTTLSDATGGGVWTSAIPATATVGSAGIVTGIAAGTTTISYTVTTACGIAAATQVVTVNPLPVAGIITGTVTVCALATTPLADAAGGGAWSSTATGIATVGTSGLLAGVSAGTATISYTVINGCGTAAATKIVTVNPLPVAGSITGTATVCALATTPLADGAGGGAWSSTATGIATVGTSGIVSGVSMGTATISYTVINGCGTAAATKIVTVNPLPIGGSITGTAVLCQGATTPLIDGAGGGAWSSTATGTATVGTAGVVTGMAAGTATISYTVTNGCGTAAATQVVTVNAIPAAISGPASVCTGLTITLTDGGTGTWTSSNTGQAIVGSSSGVVTGIAAGTPTITYAFSTGCLTTIPVTVNATPGAISGTMVVCAGASTTLSVTGGGSGSWASSSTGLATVGSGTGVVTGIAAGTPTITYTTSAGCTTTTTVTVNLTPVAITGTPNVCQGLTTTLGDLTSGGTWSSGNMAIGTIDPGLGVVTGISAGTTAITYALSTGCMTTKTVTVNALPLGITGTTSVCQGLSTVLHDATGGGNWSSGTTGVAIIGSSTGTVTGMSSGTAMITYTIFGTGCTATTSVTVNPQPSTITGTMNVCVAATTGLSNTTTGGTWTSGSTGIATIGSLSGMVTGVSTGTSVITYALNTGCLATTTITVDPLALVPSAIAGTITLCAGTTTALSDTIAGGTWSSVSPGIATIGSTGIVTGLSAGTTTISYTEASSCGSVAATKVVTINPAPNAGTISGVATLCAGANATLTDGATGGAWSSTSSGVATVGSVSGIVSAISAGIDTIKYTVTNGCGTAVAPAVMTIFPLPVAGVITGATNLCVGTSTTLTDPAPGGIWSSSNARATVAGGLVTGVSAGIDTIYYSVTGVCGTVSARNIMTVIAAPNAGTIAGSSNVCIGSVIALTDPAGGGLWGASNARAGVSAGVVSGVSAGVDTVFYAVANACGADTATKIVTVNSLPFAGAISGASSVCIGTAITLSDTASGGTWSSGSPAIATVGSLSGIVTGLSAGLVNISYSVTNLCGTARNISIISVSPLPNVGLISGPHNLCAGSTISLTDTVTGGSWSSSCACANVTGGVVNGVSAGTAVISYSITGSCGTAASATRTVTVNDLPTVFGVTGGGTECNGASYGFHVGLSTSIIGVNYQLYYNGAPLGSPLAGIYGPLDFGIQTGLGSYTVIAKNDSTGCANNMSGAAIIKLDTPLAPLVTVEAFPGTNLAVGQGATFEVVSYYSGAYPSYQWKINNTVVPGATSYIFFCTPFMLFNLDTVSCIVTIQGICGDISGIGSVGVTLYGVGVKPVTSNDMDLVLIPNPNNGQFTVKGTLDANNGEEVTLTITDLLGQQVYNDNVTAKGGLLNEQIQLNGTLANGMYLLNVRSGTENKVFHFVLKQ